MKQYARFAVGIVLSGVLIIVLIFGLQAMGLLSLATWQGYALYFQSLVRAHYAMSVMTYMVGYALIVISGVPLFIPLTLLAGYLFGLWWGTVYAVISANTGALLSFMLSRYVFYAVLLKRYQPMLAKYRARLAKQGYALLLALQLAMVFPYVVINTIAALSGVSLITFFWTSVIGSFPMIFIHVFAGQQLQLMTSMHGIVPNYIWLFFLLLALILLGYVVKRSQLVAQEDL